MRRVFELLQRIGMVCLCGILLTGCAGESAETGEDAFAAPLPAEEEIVWVSDNTSALYGIQDTTPLPEGAIAIRNAEDLASIGRTEAFPMDGDYVLTADLDLTGVVLDAIGGAASACGIVSGENVFSGTFDGRGHTLRGLTMDFSVSTRAHAGLFGSVGSDDPDDPAVIRNLILKEVDIRGSFGENYTMGALAGQVSGYAVIDDIALLSGKVAVESGAATLGVGALIGQIRTQTDTGCSNAGVYITDIYTGLQVYGYGTDVTGALIGRIRASDLGELSRVIITGQALSADGKGRAVCGGDSVPLVSENVWYISSAGTDHRGIGQSRSSSSLKKLPGDEWASRDGLYSLPVMVWNSPVFSPALDSLHFQVAPGNTVGNVQYDFTLPLQAGGQELVWVSDDPDHLRIEGSVAIVTRPAYGNRYVKLTVTTPGDLSRVYTLRITGESELSLRREGNWLVAEGYPAGMDYCWVTEDPATGETDFLWNTTGRFLLPGAVTVSLRAEGFSEQVYTPPSVPTMYIDCRTGYYGLNKSTAADADFLLETPEGKTEYSGGGTIKLRGNSSAGQVKRPFKLKLDTKEDLFGMGKNRHWVLLANWYDRTNLRNVLSYEMSGRLGMWYCESVWVDLYYNGEYCGLYQLCENIRVDEERTDIFDWDGAAETVASLYAADHGLDAAEREKLAVRLSYDLTWVTRGTDGVHDLQKYIDALDLDISGGYLIENDSYSDEPSKFTTENGVMYMVTAPNSLVESRDMFRYVKSCFQAVEDAIFSPDRRNGDGEHYADLMDMDSFADFWFVNEFFKNGEMLFKSTFLSLDVGGKLTWGPVWDMDWAGGNHVNLGEDGQNPAGWVHGGGERQVWSRSLFTDPYAVLLLWEAFDKTVTDAMDACIADLDTYARQLEDAAVRDNARWQYPDSYEKEIRLFREWITGRRDWMTAQFASPDTLLASLGMYRPSETMEIAGAMRQGDTLTLTMTIRDGAAPCGLVLVNGVSCGTAVLGETVTVTVPAEAWEKTGAYDAVQVLGCTPDGICTVTEERGGIAGCDLWDSAYIFIPR
ncbi:MAG: CotH kinase family protein [Clostridia bacterium]|nr:CotH kinase family protein [Clostridia bacterium]